MEIVGHQRPAGQLADTAVEAGKMAQSQRKGGAGLASQNRIELAQLAVELIGLGMKEQADLIALGVAVEDAKAALHQMLSRRHHQIPEERIKGGLERVCLPCQPGEAAPIQPGHHPQAGQNAVVVGRLEAAQGAVQIVEGVGGFFHCILAFGCTKSVGW